MKTIKKIILAIGILLFACPLFAQDIGKIYEYNALNSRFALTIMPKNFIYVRSNKQLYYLSKEYSAGSTLQRAITAGDMVNITQYLNASVTLTGKLTIDNSIVVNDTVFVGGSTNYLFQNTVNGLKVPNSLTVTDTGFIPVVSTSSKYILGSQAITQNTVNGASFNNSVTVTDTLFANSLKSSTFLMLAGTDTVTAAPVGSICFKQSDSSLYVKIRADGTTHARWIKFSRAVMP